MARIWQEGFEDGLPHSEYLEGNPNSQFIYLSNMTSFPNEFSLSNGRNLYSEKSLRIKGTSSLSDAYITKTITSTSELYVRAYVKIQYLGVTNVAEEIITLFNSGTKVLGIYQDSAGGTTFSVRTLQSGSYASRQTFTLSTDTWYKIDIYLKVDSSTGAYEVKLDNVSVKSDLNLNTGTGGISSLRFGVLGGAVDIYFDDLAINDTSGSVNNSWCGDGTIVSLKPKGSGNKSQWDTCEGYAKAEASSGTTTLKITGHGLSTNDVIFNKTRNAYSIVTFVDANTLTTSSITGQAENDIILLYKNAATITATSGTSTTMVVISGHTMNSGDVIVNTSRSNAIRKVIYVNSNNVYNYYDTSIDPPNTLGATVTSQASGDSIKTFAFTPYAITNHWEAISNQTDPSPKLSYIKSSTSGDIDTFDMEELVADKGLPSGSTIVAVSHNTYAQEAGAGSQITPVFRISGTDYEGSAISLSGGTLQYQQIYETSPATSSAWSRSEIDGLEAGVKLV